MIQAEAPGKLFIAGEYAVVEPGEPAILIAVDRVIRVTATPATGGGSVVSAHYNDPLRWHITTQGQVAFGAGTETDLVTRTIEIAAQCASDRGVMPREFDLVITSELTDEHGTKYGLGSSAAVTVALVRVLSEAFGLGLTREATFKLALLATLGLSPRASGGDIAASTYGGWVLYTSPDRDWVRDQLRTLGAPATLQLDWPGLKIRSLPSPRSVRLSVGWTGEPADTDTLVAFGARTHHSFARFVCQSRSAIERLARAITSDEPGDILSAYALSRDALLTLDQESGGGIETRALRDLRLIAERYGAVAKPSGAGGGDSGIALIDHRTQVNRMCEEWRERDIEPLELAVYPQEDPR